MSIDLNQINTRELGRYLQLNEKAFILNNIMRMKTMTKYASLGFSSVYRNIPLLLQVNEPNRPGYVAGGDEARGIFSFERSGFSRLYRQAYPNKSLKNILSPRPIIQSVMLIGSVGSIGHTSMSDLDYWICVDKTRMNEADFGRLEEKLDKISYWAEKRKATEVHFFLHDLREITSNTFGELADESSGDLMPRLLKEEFYRTALHVAGRLPLWWAVPPGTGFKDYQKINELLDDIEIMTFDPYDFVDLGFPHPPEPREYLGAALWQVHKAQRDPFKAVLKMILIQEQVESNLKSSLLCDQVKRAILAAGPDQLPVDPYLITIKRVLAFAQKNLPEYLELVRTSALFKLYAPLSRERASVKDDKIQTLLKMIRPWGWSVGKIQDIFDYVDWADGRKLALGQEIKDMLLDLYSRIAARLRQDYAQEVLLTNQNMIKLNAQILAVYTHHEAKVEELPSVFHRRDLVKDMNLVFSDQKWQLINSLEQSGDVIYSADRAARVAAWLVHNRLWGSSFMLRIRPDKSPMKKRAIMALLPLLVANYPLINISSFEDSSLLPRPQGPKTLVINMETSSDSLKVQTAEIIYRTNIGEMCHEVLDLPFEADEPEIYRFLADSLFQDDWKDQVNVFVPPGQSQDVLVKKIETAIDSIRCRQADLKSSDHKSGKAKLDLD